MIKDDLTIRTVDVPLRLGRGATHGHFPKLRGGINWRFRTGTGELLVWDTQYGRKMSQEMHDVLAEYLADEGYSINATYDWAERRDQEFRNDWRASDQFASVHGINPEEDKVKFKSKVLRSPSGNYERGDWKGWDKMQKLDRQVLGASAKEYVPSWKRPGNTSESVTYKVVGPANDRTIQAFVGDEYAGMAGYTKRGRVGNVVNIGVVPKYRRQGIATELYRRLKDEARKAGVSTLRGDVTSPEGAALWSKSFGGAPGQGVQTASIREAVSSFHGTDAVFDDFEYTGDIGFHFGSAETANARLNQMSGEDAPGEGANIRPVTLDIKNPLRLPDLHDWNPVAVASTLVDQGIISQDQADAAEIVDKDQVQAWLGAHGYDSIVYSNETEARGDSYIVFDPALIRPRFGSSKA